MSATVKGSNQRMEQQAAAIRERDLALAMHETFLGSGSEDALSPRFLNLDIRSPPSSFSPRTPHASTPRPSSAPSSSSSSPAAAPAAWPGVEIPKLSLVGQRNAEQSGGQKRPQQQSGQKKEVGQKLDEQKEGDGEEGRQKFEACLKRLRETEFEHHETGAVRLNNGSFGTCPRSVVAQQGLWAQKWSAQPDEMYYGPLQKGLLASRQLVAAHVNCPTDELVLVDNVTVAASIVAVDVMWSFVEGHFQKGDCILLSNFIYKALEAIFEAYAVRAGAHILTAEIPFPTTSSQQILDAYERVLREAQREGRRIRLAVLDHVVSMPSIILPVQELVALCRSYAVEQVFVDGAQALGNVEDLDLTEVDADYYAGNLHKWFFAPTSVAFFHSKAKHMSRLHHPIISHNYGKGLAAECEWMGTRDFSAFLAVPAAFEFFNKIPGGYDAVRAYNHKKIVAAGRMLAAAWGTDIGVAPELCGCMAMVGLPPALGIQTLAETLAFRTRLRNEFSIEVHTFTPDKEQTANFPVKGVTAHLRLSHQIYNTWAEYFRLRDVINGLVVEESKQ